MTWADARNALHAWIVAATGYAANRVTWWRQGDPVPSGTTPWISLSILNDDAVGFPGQAHERVHFTVADTVESVDATANTLTLTAHGLLTGDGPIRIASTLTVPGGLVAATDYWAVRVDANTIRLAETHALAVAASPTTIDITSAGSGTITIASTDETERHGAEIRHYARQSFAGTLSVQLFGGAATDSPLRNLRGAAALPTVHAALVAAGVGLGTIGPIRALGNLINSTYFEPRSVVEVRFFTVEETSELGTYIETCEPERS